MAVLAPPLCHGFAEGIQGAGARVAIAADVSLFFLVQP